MRNFTAGLLKSVPELVKNAAQLLKNATQLPKNAAQLLKNATQLPKNAAQLVKNEAGLPNSVTGLCNPAGLTYVCVPLLKNLPLVFVLCGKQFKTCCVYVVYFVLND